MFPPFPPNSRVTFFIVSAAFFWINFPALVEPVNETISISEWPEIWFPTTSPLPLTKLKTPGGKPASSIISANKMPDIGAISEGFNIIVQPAANAGITFNTIWFIGKFQGVINPHTPIGSYLMWLLDLGSNWCSKLKSFKIFIVFFEISAPIFVWVSEA